MAAPRPIEQANEGFATDAPRPYPRQEGDKRHDPGGLRARQRPKAALGGYGADSPLQ